MREWHYINYFKINRNLRRKKTGFIFAVAMFKVYLYKNSDQ